jgi:predicted metal-dependent phosphoesterase TrpH
VRVDLHCHSTSSDGTDPADVVAARARAAGVELFSLTDHDTCAGHAAAALAFPAARRGLELSCEHGGRTVHVLMFDTGGAWRDLEAMLAERSERRKDRLRTIAAWLHGRGIRLDVEKIIAASAAQNRTVGRPDLARALCEAGFAVSMDDAFNRYLYDGGPGDPGGHRLTLEAGLAVGRSVDARMALAHPHLLGEQAAQLLRRYKSEGLDAVEAYYGSYTRKERARWTRLADELGLVCTAGSDRHSEADPELGIDLPESRAERLLTWLQR